MSSSFWTEPIQILEDLGLLSELFPEPWTAHDILAPPLGWLPLSAAPAQPPLGPPRAAIPFELSPLELLCLKASMGPVFPIDSRAIGLALLEPEFDHLPELRWLSPQGWTWWLMGAESWLELP